MISIVKCVARNCSRTLFEVTSDFQGGVIVRCRRCGNYQIVNSQTESNLLSNYEPQDAIVITICEPSVPTGKNED